MRLRMRNRLLPSVVYGHPARAFAGRLPRIIVGHRIDDRGFLNDDFVYCPLEYTRDSFRPLCGSGV